MQTDWMAENERLQSENTELRRELLAWCERGLEVSESGAGVQAEMERLRERERELVATVRDLRAVAISRAAELVRLYPFEFKGNRGEWVCRQSVINAALGLRDDVDRVALSAPPAQTTPAKSPTGGSDE